MLKSKGMRLDFCMFLGRFDEAAEPILLGGRQGHRKRVGEEINFLSQIDFSGSFSLQGALLYAKRLRS